MHSERTAIPEEVFNPLEGCIPAVYHRSVDKDQLGLIHDCKPNA